MGSLIFMDNLTLVALQTRCIINHSVFQLYYEVFQSIAIVLDIEVMPRYVPNLLRWYGNNFMLLCLCLFRPIDTVSNLVFWSCFVNELEPWHVVYIMQQ